MKKYLIRIIWLLCALMLISYGLAACSNQEDSAFVEGRSDDQRKMDRLFSDMGIIKAQSNAEPIDFALLDITGRKVFISYFKGKIVFLNFWATWCPPCREEMPSMEKLHQKFKEKDFAMVTINLQESAPLVRGFLKKHNLSFTTLLDSKGEIGARFGIRSIPTTIILDKEGKVIGVAMGAREWDNRKAIALFAQLADGKRSSPQSAGQDAKEPPKVKQTK